MRDGLGLGQFADIVRDNKATFPPRLQRYSPLSHIFLGLTAQAIILSALRDSSLLYSETDSKIRQAHRQFLKALRDLSLRLPTGENDFSYASARFYSLMDIAKALCVDRRNRLGEGRSDNILID